MISDVDTDLILLLIISWAIYFTLHSVLASNVVKNTLTSKLGLSQKTQRIIYNLISAAGLLGLLFLNGIVKSDKLIQSFNLLKPIAMLIAGAGVLIINAAFKQYDLGSFLGTKDEIRELRIEGILKYVRHPFYSGLILIVIGFFLFDSRVSTLISSLCILIYLPIGIFLEERKLIKLFGEKYIKYKKEIPALIPKLF